MPEVRFRIRWPDGSEEACYSPSTVIATVLAPDQAYPLDDFLARARAALAQASERVEAQFGAPCSLASGQLARIESRASAFAGDPTATVTCLAVTPGGSRP